MTGKPNTTWKILQALSLRSLPIRDRLVRGSVVIVFLAIAVMGIFVIWRTRQTNANLINTFDAVTLERANSILAGTADRLIIINYMKNLVCIVQ